MIKIVSLQKRTEKLKESINEKKEKGILTLDFIFSVTAIYSISMVFTLLSVTLMFSTLTQYIAFSMARAHISGRVSQEKQQLALEEQMRKLLEETYLGNLIKTNENEGWFRVELRGPASEVISLDQDGGGDTQIGYGVHLKYTSNILRNVRLPLLGSPSDGADEDFGTADIYGLLYREPTTEECLRFNDARWSSLKERFPRINQVQISNERNFGAEADNGC